ncbi:MAG: hypothetical protein AAEJ04_08010 [Planctomycetota bacterium]
MESTGPARPDNKGRDPQDGTGELDETLENLTMEVAKAAKINSTPIVIGVLLVLGIIMLPSVMDKMKEREIQAWNNEIDATLSGEVDEVRATYPKLLEKIKGQALEKIAIEKVARWLWDRKDTASRQESVNLLEMAQQSFPADYVIGTYLQEFRSSLEASANFVLPEPPEPVVVEPVVVEPVVVEPVVPVPPNTPAKPETTAEKPVISDNLGTLNVPAVEEKPEPEEDLGPPAPGGDGN